MADGGLRPRRSPVSISSLALFLVDVGILALLGFVIWAVVPTFGKMFMETGEELPPLTRVVLGLSDRVRGYWFLFLPLVLAVVGLMGAKEVYLDSPARDWLNIAWCVLLLAACGIVIVSLFLPLVSVQVPL